jgi:bifunctional non-homologous end joining protein LigD
MRSPPAQRSDPKRGGMLESKRDSHFPTRYLDPANAVQFRVRLAPVRCRPPFFHCPLLPTLSSEPPTGDGWLDEIKHDDNRSILTVARGNARAFTRRCWTGPASAEGLPMQQQS